MQYVVRFVSARSGAGKTAIASKIVSILRSRGLIVGAVKHCSSEIALEEKDTKKYIDSGATLVVASAPGMLIAYYPGVQDDLELVLGFVKAPIVVVEGYKYSTVGDAVLVAEDPAEVASLGGVIHNLVAAYTRKPGSGREVGVPVFEPGEEEKLAQFIEDRALDQLTGKTGELNCRACGYQSCRELVTAYVRGSARWCPVRSDVRLSVDGYGVEINPFVKAIIRSVVLGLIEPLKNVPRNKKRVVIEIES